MSLRVLTGPPGSGRTTTLLARAREAMDEGLRVWWVGLPAQRAHLLRRLTAEGYAALGFEYMSSQQLYYRLLTAATDLRALVVGTARLVRVVEALVGVDRALPTPGEARLFAAAIAEAKRFGVGSEEYAALAADHEQRRFAQVYAAYQAGMTGVWDYDDARQAALALVERPTLAPPTDLVIVDGLREVGPLELRVLAGLAEHVSVHLSLPTLPPGLAADETLPARDDVRLERFAAASPVEEGRWVMRALKQDLFERGMEPLDLAVVAPRGRASALVALAAEYGVPLMDETPMALADEGHGRVLLDLLELPETPTPTRLLAVPELAELGRAALEAGVAGVAAVTELARRHGQLAAWQRWQARLQADGEPVAWARDLLREALPDAPADLVERAMGKAQEAARLGSGAGFRAWWAALLKDAREPRRGGAGVALLDANLVSGRRYRKAYLLGAVEGAYGAGEREDYFMPEERRLELGESFECLGLPRRFQGRDEVVAAELLRRADHLVVTAPLGDQGGPLVPDPALMGATEPPELPLVPAGSRLELSGAVPYVPDLSAVDLGRPYVETLRRYRDCSFRLWGETAMRAAAGAAPEGDDDGTLLRAALLRTRGARLGEERLEELVAAFPERAEWLRAHAATLLRLTFGVELGGRPGYAAAYLHATEKVELPGGGVRVDVYRFVPFTAAWDASSADDLMSSRWTEYWAVGAMHAQPAFRVESVHVFVWPIGGEPIDLARGGVRPGWRRVVAKREMVDEVLPAFLRGEVRPNPGFICRDCPVFDLCREGVR